MCTCTLLLAHVHLPSIRAPLTHYPCLSNWCVYFTHCLVRAHLDPSLVLYVFDSLFILFTNCVPCLLGMFFLFLLTCKHVMGLYKHRELPYVLHSHFDCMLRDLGLGWTKFILRIKSRGLHWILMPSNNSTLTPTIWNALQFFGRSLGCNLMSSL